MSTARGRRGTACAVLVLACAGAVAASSARADDAQPRSELWGGVSAPRAQRVRDLMRQALLLERDARRLLPPDVHGLCVRALSLQPGPESLAIVRGASRAVRSLARPALQRRTQIEGALARLALARELAPDDGEVQRATARLLAQWEEPQAPWTCASTRRDGEALAALQALRASHPELAPEETSFELAVALTREQRFAEAARTYLDAAPLVAADGEQAVTARTNLAETTMLAGDLEGAVEHYKRALALAGGGRSYELALWGLAVAVDRLGEHAEALGYAEKALHSEGWALRVLRSENVFFEPAHELHYYEGLGHEALAAQDQADRLGELAAAATSYRAYLQGDGGRGPFADTAEADLARVVAALKLERARKPRRAPPLPPLTPPR